MKSIPLEKPGVIWKRILAGIILVGMFFAATNFLAIDAEKFTSRLGNVPEVLDRMSGINLAIVPDILQSALISLFLAVISVTLSTAISLVLSFLAAENITPAMGLSVVIKAFVAIIRSIPSLVLGLIVIASIGFGNTSAVFAMTVAGTGYLTKAFTSTIEDIGTDVIEAIGSTGSSWWGIVIHGLFPSAITGFLSWLTIEIENSISLSVSLGMLGITGLGLLLSNAQMKYQYTNMTTIILFIFLMMFILELTTTKIREDLNGDH